MTVQVLNGPTIAAGASLSNALNVSNGVMFRLIMPSEWTPALLTFQISHDGLNFYNVFDADGKELARPIVPQSIMPFGHYVLDIHSIKLRSGTLRYPIDQQFTREFKIVVETSNQLARQAANDIANT